MIIHHSTYETTLEPVDGQIIDNEGILDRLSGEIEIPNKTTGIDSAKQSSVVNDKSGFAVLILIIVAFFLFFKKGKR